MDSQPGRCDAASHRNQLRPPLLLRSHKAGAPLRLRARAGHPCATRGATAVVASCRAHLLPGCRRGRWASALSDMDSRRRALAWRDQIHGESIARGLISSVADRMHKDPAAT
eukprot:365380-Chlamydomonas_euryale.AAC.4